MAATAIDPRAWQEAMTFLTAFGIDARADVQHLLATIDPSRVTPATISGWRELQAMLARFRAFHQQYPFRVAPAGTLSTGAFRTPLHQLADDQAVMLDERELTEHLGLFGRSGGGKTTCAHHLAREAYGRGLNVLTIDGKDDARSFPITYPDTLIIDKDTPLPLIEPPSWLSAGEARAQLILPLKQTMWGGEGLQQVATESHAHTFDRHERPSVADWRDEVRRLARKGDTYMRRDRCDGLALRLDRLIEQYPGIGRTRAGSGIPLELLCTRSVYFGFGLHTEIEDFLTQWLLELRFSYNRAHERRTLNTFVLLDESNLLVHDRTIAEQAPLVPLFPLLREFGISVCLTAANYNTVPLPIRSSLYLQVAMNLTDAREATDVARTFGLTDTQRTYLDTMLTRGMCIAKLGDRWKHPFLARVEPLAITKTVDESAWRAALARTTAVARPARAPLHVHPIAATEEVTTQPALPAPPRSSTAAQDSQLNRIALNENEEKLLRFIGEHKVVLTTECDLHPQILTRAKRKLLTLGLITEERITARAGRGGQASAVALTSAGAAWLRLTPGGAGGGGLQHQYLVRKLLDAIPGAEREVSLGGKRVDVLFTYTTEHAWIARVVGIALNTGDPVAIEVEVSDPAKTASSNLTKNAAAGVSHTIVAVLPAAVERTREVLGSAIIVNVFDLLKERA